MARVSGTTREISAGNDLTTLATEYLKIKESMDMLKTRQSELREKLFEFIEESGQEDDKGNLWLDLPEEVTGARFLQKQCRVSRSLDESAAEEIITEKELQKVLYKTVQVVDQDAVMQALQDDLLTVDEVDSMFPPKVTWALTTPKK
jgi:hypothetical protein